MEEEATHSRVDQKDENQNRANEFITEDLARRLNEADNESQKNTKYRHQGVEEEVDIESSEGIVTHFLENAVD